jgi:hypothetical protein
VLSVLNAVERDGAFMEPSGRNRWQPVANGAAAKPAQRAETVAVSCDQLPQASLVRRGSTVRVRQRA